MQPLYEKLAKILKLEAERGFTNTAVIGGIEGFLSFWYEEMRAGGRPADIFLVDEVVTRLRDYATLSPEARREAVEAVLLRLGHELPPSPKPRPAARRRRGRKPRPRQPRPEPTAEPSSAQAPTVTPATTPVADHAEAQELTEAAAERLLELDARLDEPVRYLPGVGERRAAHLRRLGIETVRDLLYHLPHRYDDFRTMKAISELVYGETVTVTGVVQKTESREGRRRGTLIITSLISDGTGVIQATWFNQPHLMRQLTPGRPVRLSGRVGQYLGRLVFESPEWEPVDRHQFHTGGLIPVYPLTSRVPIKWLRALIRKTLASHLETIPDPLPKWLRVKLGMLELATALHHVHNPPDNVAAERGRQRLAFDELLLLQIGVLQQRRQWKALTGVPLPADEAVLRRFEEALPFELTRAQRRALREIVDDMAQAAPMSRLLQGDVGSGKTVVAAAALLVAVAAGHQGALMAPTEILAEQHARSLNTLLNPESGPLLHHGRPVRVALLVGRLSPGEKEAVCQHLAAGEVDIVVGTHALIQEHVTFSRLGLVVVDEQHRFGVRQRAALREKGHNPHVLVMSATPIPRSLALTIYGDLDLSIIDELPPGRRPVKTVLLTPRERERAYRFIQAQVEQGRQAFIICPLVEGSDKVAAKAAVEEYNRLQREIFPHLRLGLLHGRMRPDEKEAIMAAFYRGELHILVSTAVVEVGIDVPNATVMLIESANRFGLAQLHQFRGRVGRGAHESYCLLLADETLSPEGEERLHILVETHDGFRLAEEDLRLRGPGEFLGTRQSGVPDLRVARLGDTRTLDLARRAAQMVLEQDPDLTRPEHGLLRKHVERFWARVEQTDLS
ncbi:MAG: ATP-dependent DNA helicase RecG [Ardenticatenia bacterium]|nr:ATP-dependent DNA helicase RecG [Ardenticatenia bacterium]